MEKQIRRLDWLLVVALALILRLAFNWRFATDTAHADIASMYQYSLRVAGGVYYGPGVYWPPAFIFLSGFLIRFFGAGRYWTVIRGVNSVLGALSCGFAYDAGRAAYGSRAAGLLSGALLAVYVPLIYYTGLAFSEILFIFFFLWALVHLYRLAEKRDYPSALAAGTLLGLASLTRPIALPVPLLLVPWYWLLWERRSRLVLSRVAALTAASFLVLLPWTVRNYLVTGDFVLVDMNGGVNFYIGHNEKATGTWMDLGQKTNPVILLGGSPEAGKIGFRRGLAFIKAHPRQELALAWRKFSWFWSKPSDWYITRWAKEHRLPHWQPPVWGALAVAGSIIAWRRWRGTLFLILFALYYNAVIVAVYFACRYRLVVEPVWLILAAGGMAELWQWVRLRYQQLPD